MHISNHAQTWNKIHEAVVHGMEIAGTITSCFLSKNSPLVCIPALVGTFPTLNAPVPAHTKP